MKKMLARFLILSRLGKIRRYRLYKSVGFLGYRKRVDQFVKSLFCLLFVCVTAAVLHLVSFVPKESSMTLSDITDEIFADNDESEESVVPQQLTLDDLEKGVSAGKYILNTYTLEKKETFSGLLKRANVQSVNRAELTEDFGLLMNLKSLQPGMNFMIFTDKEGDFLGIAYQKKSGDMISVVKDSDGAVVPVTQEGRIETKRVRMSGVVERTFSGSAKKVGIPTQIVNAITNALDGEVDFSTMKAGDTFEVIFEQKETTAGLEIGDKELLFVGLSIGKKKVYRYVWSNGTTSSFYNPKGQSAQKALYKRPLKATPRVSSPYGWRQHPVLMTRIFHSGVDLACKMGTPIVAAGDGVITQLGRKGAYGKYIRIKHTNGYQTAYAHMNGYKDGLKVGSKVKRGDVIGYVGQTGRTTGPHLHFEVWKDGKTVSPFGKYILVAKQLQGQELERFQAKAAEINPDFQKHLIGTLAPVPPKKPMLAAAQPNVAGSAPNVKKSMPANGSAKATTKTSAKSKQGKKTTTKK